MVRVESQISDGTLESQVVFFEEQGHAYKKSSYKINKSVLEKLNKLEKNSKSSTEVETMANKPNFKALSSTWPLRSGMKFERFAFTFFSI